MTTRDVTWDEEVVMQNAYRAYYKGYKGRENLLDCPASYSCVQEHDGRDYAVLRNSIRVLAVYRIDRHGYRCGQAEWPKALEEW